MPGTILHFHYAISHALRRLLPLHNTDVVFFPKQFQQISWLWGRRPACHADSPSSILTRTSISYSVNLDFIFFSQQILLFHPQPTIPTPTLAPVPEFPRNELFNAVMLKTYSVQQAKQPKSRYKVLQQTCHK